MNAPASMFQNIIYKMYSSYSQGMKTLGLCSKTQLIKFIYPISGHEASCVFVPKHNL